MTPWQRLDLARRKHEEAKARVQCAEQLAHLGAGRARELAAAQQEERHARACLALAEVEVEQLRREELERRQVVPPHPADHEVLHVLDQLDRKVFPEAWEKALRESGVPADRRALRHLAWLRELRREGLSVEAWCRGARVRGARLG
jgi:hypothetical protein